MTQKVGLERSGWFYGVTIGGYNNDGFDDIFITGWPQNLLIETMATACSAT